MTERLLGPTGQRRKRLWLIGPLSALAMLVGLFATSAAVAVNNVNCTTADTLADSTFEIDAIVAPGPNAKKNELPTGGANLKLDDDPDCTDWNSVTEITQPDALTGSGDEAFGQGTAENDPVPTIVTDSIPPNKSDLIRFGIHEEVAGTKTFVAVYWARINSPQGTTNMDFEFNKKQCTPSTPLTPPTDADCSANGLTPIRSTGDKLLLYELSSGGTVVNIDIRTWNGSEWIDDTLSASSALGSINYAAISDSESGPDLGSLDVLTFGEAVIDFNALLGGATCGEFGSVYLKSRSSDSFQSELKDFVKPLGVDLSNCAAISTSATTPVTVGDNISDTATLSNVSAGAGGTITFRLFPPSDANCVGTPVFTDTKPVSGPGNYTSDTHQTTEVGTYRWIASYSGDGGNSAVSGACGDAGESSVVSKDSPAIVTNATASITIGGTITDSATLSNGTSDISGTITFRLFSDAACANEITLTAAQSTATVSGNATYSPTTAYMPTAVGTYYWIASYGGDAKNNAVSGACGDANESSVVSKDSPAIVTNATASITIGGTITDSATLSNGTSDISGTITFRLFSDAACANEITLTAAQSTATVSGNATYSPTTAYMPTAVGTYYWIASYGGDAKNNAVSGACGDANEASVVNKGPSGIATAQSLFPQDSATVSNGATPTGSVTFELYGPSDPNCTGTTAFSQVVPLSGGTASTTNTTFSISTATAALYKWKVIYGGDATHLGSTSACGDERFTLTIDNDAIS